MPVTPEFDLSSMMLWDDNPATIDLLGVNTVVKAITNALSADNLDPLTIGIHSPWGGGKTTSLGLLESSLSAKEEYITIRTNPWEYDNHDDVRSLLIAEIVQSLQEKFNTEATITEKAGDLLKRISWSRVTTLVAKGAITMQWNPDEIVKAFTPKPRETPESMSGFREDFSKFLDMLPDVERVVVLVDDLDRCLPNAVMATLEAIKLFLSVKKMAFVLATDQKMVRDAISASLEASGRNEVFANMYLEKIVQLPVALPRLTPDQTATYIALLFSAAASPDEVSFTALVEHCEARRIAGQTPVLSNMSELTWKPSNELLAIAERISDGLSVEKSSNPRYVKRFLNAFSLRVQVAKSNGVTIEPEVIAKLYLLEDRHLKDFEHLVALTSEERTQLITNWEKWGREEMEDKPVGISDGTRAWAGAAPGLTGISLDTYLTLAASFTNMALGANLNDDQIAVISGLASPSETKRQTAVTTFGTKAASEQNLIVEGLFGTVRRTDDIDPLIHSLTEIAKSTPAHGAIITAGIKDYCWNKIGPAAATLIMYSEVPELVALGPQMMSDDAIKPETKQAVEQASEG